MEHFGAPRNVGVMEDPDVHVRVESDVHNDLIDLYLQIEDGHIADIKYLVHGCVAAIASTSIASEMAKNRSLDEAVALSADDVAEALGGLPESKVTCSVLAPQALREAIAAHRNAHRT
jgi:nitrogen fixation NifU-like protein